MGPGNMWVFKHPGIFPVAEAIRLAEVFSRIPFPTRSADDEGQFKDPEVTPLLSLPSEPMEIIFGYLSATFCLRHEGPL